MLPSAIGDWLSPRLAPFYQGEKLLTLEVALEAASARRRMEMKLFWQLKTWACVILLAGSALTATAEDGKFNAHDNTLIADQFNNRVIEVDMQGNIVWQ